MFHLNMAACWGLIVLVNVHKMSCFRHFQAVIPNGAKVLDPCNIRSLWPGVGHQAREGRTARNPFGRDFTSYNKVWSKDLCQLDSDGDGSTNGEELGDPNCTWVPGDVPTGSAKSHPGVCEPVSSTQCLDKNKWLDCSKAHTAEQVRCNISNITPLFTKDLRLSVTSVPNRETSYFCQLFDLDISTDLHMVATQPLIDASEVVHHILLFGCDRKANLDLKPRSPYPCVMVPDDECRALIGAWTVGSLGDCAHPDMGFRVGPGGYRTVAIQVHWNNPTHTTGLTDTSGLRIHLTSSLRKYDAGMLVVGQQYLQINPSSEPGDVRFSATCPERCTKVMFRSPIYVTSAVNHMHYLGKSQNIKIYRNNSVASIITDQHDYNYDDPLIYNFPRAIEIVPGDEIRTTCVYKKPISTKPVCWGAATSDEMCFGFITYYPLQSLTYPWCTSMRSFPSCDRHLPDLGKSPFDGCRWWQFRNVSDPETKRIVGAVVDKCYPNKSVSPTCTDECRAAAHRFAGHPCIQGETGGYMIDKFKLAGDAGQHILEAVMSCSCQDFQFCDRKTSRGLLGNNKQIQIGFCSSMSRSSWSSQLSVSTSASLVLLVSLL